MYPYYSKLDNPYAHGPPPGPYGAGPPPPPYGMPPPAAARYPTDYRRQQQQRTVGAGACCLRCCCCCGCFMILLGITISLLVMSLFNIYDPKIPEYLIEKLDVRTLEVLPDSTLNAGILLSIRVDNPNKRIGFKYGGDSSIEVLYEKQVVCGARLPAFHQGHENATELSVWLAGRTPFSPDLQRELAEDSAAQLVPVDVDVRVPVSIVVGEAVTLREFKIYVYCHITLDHLSPNHTARILSKDTKFRFEL
ncbi:NDR1/HIN1-like protein 6 [Andrographis paniculata]|uniref:NDR1/HIN1-like protein 6 n=1 Tax=Andrographis paniculata TaxID=175694 RepID=UPI0021E8803C|nr:NDR1/HIN1-like protein 6 [Andrographis paniculata]